MSVPTLTPLQRATVALADLVRSSRETLDDRSYEAFVATAVLVVEREAGRLLLGEALRALRDDGQR